MFIHHLFAHLLSLLFLPLSHFPLSYFPSIPSFLSLVSHSFLSLSFLSFPLQVIAPSRASRSADATRERGREKEAASRNSRNHKVTGGRQRDTPKGFYTDINDSEDEGTSRNDRRASARRKKRDEESEEEDSDESEEESNSDSSDDDEGGGDGGGDSEEEGKDSGPAHWTCTVRLTVSPYPRILAVTLLFFSSLLHCITCYHSISYCSTLCHLHSLIPSANLSLLLLPIISNF